MAGEGTFGSRLSADPNASFYYAPLVLDDIRLIRFLPRSTPSDIRLELFHRAECFGGAVDYYALSYVWGNAKTTKSITINSHRFEVTRNLWHALGALFEHHDAEGLYWIDAICLNQFDIQERNHQVHDMWRVYSNAKTVLAWLGPENQTIVASFCTLEQIARTCKGSSKERCPGWKRDHSILPDSCMDCMDALINNPLFGRTWIIQEFCAGPPLELALWTTLAAWKHSVSFSEDLRRNANWRAYQQPMDARDEQV